MGKTPKLKSATKYSRNSRSARQQAGSPGIDLDEVTVRRRKGSSDQDSLPSRQVKDRVLSASTGKNIIGKKKALKPLKRKQRLRQEQGRERAENVIERTVSKVVASLDKDQRVRSRRRNWDEINQLGLKDLNSQDGHEDKGNKKAAITSSVKRPGDNEKMIGSTSMVDGVKSTEQSGTHANDELDTAMESAELANHDNSDLILMPGDKEDVADNDDLDTGIS